MDFKQVSFTILILLLIFLVVNILKRGDSPLKEEKLKSKLTNVLNYFKMNSYLINLDSFITLAFSQSI